MKRLLPLQTTGSGVIDTFGLNKADRLRIKEVGVDKWLDEISGVKLITTHDAVTVAVKLPEFPKGIGKLKIPLEVSLGKTWQIGKSKLKAGSTGDIMCFAFLKIARENKNIVTYEQCAILCPAYPGDPVAWARQAGAEVSTERKNKRYVVIKYV